MAKRYEYKDAKSKKFWEVSVSGKKVNIRYGKIGTDGQTSLKELGTLAEAKALNQGPNTIPSASPNKKWATA